jgi:uncharacterized protein YggE
VHLGQVMRVSDISSYGTTPMYGAAFDARAGALAPTTQLPVGELDVQVTVEVDFAII